MELVPIIDGNVVNSLFLFRVDDAPDPANINGIWAQRGIAGDWFAEAWPGSTRGEVVMWATQTLGLQDPQASHDAWPMDWAQAETQGVAAAPEPVPFGDGLALNHPLEPQVSQLLDPTSVLMTLEYIGEPAAAGAITGGGGITPAPEPEPGPGNDDPLCIVSQEIYWEAVAFSVESEMIAEGSADQAFDFVLNAAGCGDCTPRVWIRKNPCAPAVCGAWTTLIPASNLGCSSNITFQRSYTKTCTRLYTEIKSDCTFIRCTQTNTQTGMQITTDTIAIPNCDFSAWVPPASPTFAVGCACNSNCQWLGWSTCP